MIWALSYDNTENGQELVQSIEQNYIKVDSGYYKYFYKYYPNPFNVGTDELLTAFNILGMEYRIFNDKFFTNVNHPLSGCL